MEQTISDLTPEQLQEELTHANAMIIELTNINGQQNTTIVSMQLTQQKLMAKIQKQEADMMKHMEQAAAPKAKK